MAYGMFGSAVKVMRKEKGITLKRLCEVTGLDYYVMSHIENGIKGFRPSMSPRVKRDVVFNALCSMLGDEKGELIDMYYIDRGEIPPDLDKEKVYEMIRELRRTL